MSFWERLLRPHPDEAGYSLWFQEEARAERMTAAIRVLYLLVWMAATGLTTATHPAYAVRVNLGGGAAWLAAAALYLVRLRARPYRTGLKYASLTADMLFTFLFLFLYLGDPIGYPASLKSPVLMNFFLLMGLSTLRFNAWLPVYGGALYLGLFAGLIAWCVRTGNVAFGTRDEMLAGPKVNAVFLGYQVLYAASFAVVMVVLVRNTRRLVGLRLREAEEAFRERSERERVRATLERYFSPPVARHLLENPPALGGKLQTATVLFADLRNFTALSERLGPERSVACLNGLFAKLVEIVFRHGGTLDKFLGDGMLVVFGAPAPAPDDALRAVRAAEEMSRAATVAGDWAGLEVGVAVNTGEVLAGNIGAPSRMEFTVIGDTVNTASRLEQLNKSLRTAVLLSRATYEAVQEQVEARELAPVSLVGKAEPVRVYEFLGWKEGRGGEMLSSRP